MWRQQDHTLAVRQCAVVVLALAKADQARQPPLRRPQGNTQAEQCLRHSAEVAVAQPPPLRIAHMREAQAQIGINGVPRAAGETSR